MDFATLAVRGFILFVSTGIEPAVVLDRLPDDEPGFVHRLRFRPGFAVVGRGQKCRQLGSTHGCVVQKQPFVGDQKLRVAIIGDDVEFERLVPYFAVVDGLEHDNVAVLRVVILGRTKGQKQAAFESSERRKSVVPSIGPDRTDFNRTHQIQRRRWLCGLRK